MEKAEINEVQRPNLPIQSRFRALAASADAQQALVVLDRLDAADRAGAMRVSHVECITAPVWWLLHDDDSDELG